MHSRDVVGSVFRPSQVFFLSSVRLKMASNERAFKEGRSARESGLWGHR